MDNGQHTNHEVLLADLEHYKQLAQQLEAESLQMKEHLWVDSLVSGTLFVKSSQEF